MKNFLKYKIPENIYIKELSGDVRHFIENIEKIVSKPGYIHLHLLFRFSKKSFENLKVPTSLSESMKSFKDFLNFVETSTESSIQQERNEARSSSFINYLLGILDFINTSHKDSTVSNVVFIKTFILEDLTTNSLIGWYGNNFYLSGLCNDDYIRLLSFLLSNHKNYLDYSNSITNSEVREIPYTIYCSMNNIDSTFDIISEHRYAYIEKLIISSNALTEKFSFNNFEKYILNYNKNILEKIDFVKFVELDLETLDLKIIYNYIKPGDDFVSC